MAAVERDDDIKGLDDPALIAERRRVRDALEGSPDDGELLARWRRLDDEFMRRARSAWAGAAGT
jgi:hypothetical protein